MTVDQHYRDFTVQLASDHPQYQGRVDPAELVIYRKGTRCRLKDLIYIVDYRKPTDIEMHQVTSNREHKRSLELSFQIKRMYQRFRLI